MCRWIPHGDQQKYAKSYIKTVHHHIARIGSVQMPQGDGYGINLGDREQSHQNQHNLERSFSDHGFSPATKSTTCRTTGVMAAQEYRNVIERQELAGVFLFTIVGVVLVALTPPKRSVEKSSAVVAA